jgi:cysteine synthase
VLVPAAPFSNPNHFVHTSRRIAEETDGAIWANQFDNIANRRAHIESTAPKSGRRWKPHRRLHLRGGHRRHDRGHGHGPQGL